MTNLNYGLSSDTWCQKEIEAINRVVQSGRYTMGNEVRKYEDQFAEFMGAKHAVMTNSGSSANLLMLTAFMLHNKFPKDKTEIIVPAVSWSTTYFPVHQCGYTLKFVDIDAATLNLDIKQVTAAINENTAAIFAVNLLGNPADLLDLQQLCKDNNITLLEDNCESLGATLDGKQCATFGEMGTFSFFFSHHLQTVEGGMVVTDDDELSDYLRCIRAHGWVRDDRFGTFDKSGDGFKDSFHFVLPGYCVRPLEFCGAIGQVQLDKWPEMLKVRQANARVAKDHLNSDNFRLQSETGSSSWFGFGITLTNKLNGRRDEVIAALIEAGVECRPIVAGNFTTNPVLEHLNHVPLESYPVAEDIDKNGFFIGNDCVDLSEKIKQVGLLIRSVV